MWNSTMASWTFFGRVRPERFPVTWGTPVSGHLSQADLGLEADFSTAIHAGQVIVTLTVTSGSADILSLRNIALDCAHELTDLVGYVSGCYFDVEIVSAASRESDEWHVFGVQIPALVQRNNSHRQPTIDGELARAVLENIPAQMVLRDFQHAMRDSIATGFFCYPAIEAMMQSMKNEQIKRDKQAWLELNSSLALDRSVSEKIKSHADFPRHGKPSSMTDRERAEVFLLADEIIHRFLEYVRRGSGPLPRSDFRSLPLRHIFVVPAAPLMRS
jgi:hypothetical protein